MHGSAAQAPIATNPADWLIIDVCMTLESRVRSEGTHIPNKTGWWNFGFCKYTCTRTLSLSSGGSSISPYNMYLYIHAYHTLCPAPCTFASYVRLCNSELAVKSLLLKRVVVVSKTLVEKCTRSRRGLCLSPTNGWGRYVTTGITYGYLWLLR